MATAEQAISPGLSLEGTTTLSARTRGENPRSSQEHFKLLDLPTELRLKVWESFLPDPHGSGPEDQTLQPWNNIRYTRRALQLVSRQIHNEWTPLFFSSTTIIVHEKHIRNMEKDCRTKKERRDPTVFHTQFLHEIRGAVLECIRKISCETSIWDTPQYRGSPRQEMDLRALTNLGLLVGKEISRMPGLEEVVFSDSKLLTPPISTSRVPQGTSDEFWAARAIWRFSSRGCRWHYIPYKMQSEKRGGSLKDWIVRKEITIKADKRQWDQLHQCRTQAREFHYSPVEMQLVFRKPEHPPERLIPAYKTTHKIIPEVKVLDE